MTTLHFATCEKPQAENFLKHKDYDFLPVEAKTYVLSNLSEDMDAGFRVQDPMMHFPAQLMTKNHAHYSEVLRLTGRTQTREER